MPYVINQIIHYKDCNNFYQRLEYRFDDPEISQYVPGNYQALIPKSAKLMYKKKRQINIPLFNESNHSKIIDDLEEGGMVYLELQPNTILEKIFLEPDSIITDLLYGETSLIYSFYNSGKSQVGVITVTCGPDSKNVYSKIKAHSQDIEYRQYFLKLAIRKPGIDKIKEPEQVFPEYMTARQVASYLQVEEKTIRNWTSQKKIPFSKIGGGTVRYKRSLIDETLSPKNKS